MCFSLGGKKNQIQTETELRQAWLLLLTCTCYCTDFYLILQVMYFSKNLLTDLSNISQFRGVQILSLADNLLDQYESLEPLQSISESLESLRLEGNPLSRFPNYRAQVFCTHTYLARKFHNRGQEIRTILMSGGDAIEIL